MIAVILLNRRRSVRLWLAKATGPAQNDRRRGNHERRNMTASLSSKTRQRLGADPAVESRLPEFPSGHCWQRGGFLFHRISTRL